MVLLQRLSIFRLLSFFGVRLNACIHASYIHAKEAVIYEGVNVSSRHKIASVDYKADYIQTFGNKRYPVVLFLKEINNLNNNK